MESQRVSKEDGNSQSGLSTTTVLGWAVRCRGDGAPSDPALQHRDTHLPWAPVPALLRGTLDPGALGDRGCLAVDADGSREMCAVPAPARRPSDG